MAKKETRIKTRRPMPMQDPAKRIQNFNEVADGYSLELAQEEARRCLQCKTPTCRDGCPVEVDCKTFIRLLAEGDLKGAYQTIRETNSLPAICGRVCPQESQCEGSCKLKPTGQPIAIGRLERFVADSYYASNACEGGLGLQACPEPREDLRVAVIGSGPAGLTLAGYLAGRGIRAEVFEALHLPGGVLSYGIPGFRLPKSIVDTEVQALKDQGVIFHLDWVGGKTMGLGDLFDQGFQAVFLGLGAGLPRFMDLPGENLIGVFSANEYLTRVNLMGGYRFPKYDTPVLRGRKVTVIGGGNVAMDAARTALRLGAQESTVIYRRTQEEMPARLEELEHALEEGVKLEVLACPVSFSGDEDGYLKSTTLQRMCLGEPDASGRCRPLPVEDEQYELETDLAVIAVGSGPNQVLIRAVPELRLNPRGYIDVDPETLETSLPMVFAGGDIVTGSATVVQAMGAGRQAGKVIAQRLLDRYDSKD